MYSVPSSKASSELSDYVWKQRLIITRCDSSQQCNSVLQTLSYAEEELIEYKLVAFILDIESRVAYRKTQSATTLDAKLDGQTYPVIDFDHLRQRLGQDHTILIGLDGGTKVRAGKLSLPDLFNAISRMPMYKRP